MKDLDEDSNLSPYDIVQPKFDGWWTYTILESGIATVITSGGESRNKIHVSSPDVRILGEWIYGTNWAQNSEYKNKFMIFDILSYEGRDLSSLEYLTRMEWIGRWLHILGKDSIYMQVPTYSIESYHEMWHDFVEIEGFEGVVFRNSHDLIPVTHAGRRKKIATMNYILFGFKEGTGRLTGTLGAIEGALIINGKLQRVCTVGGGLSDSLRDEIWYNKEQYIGRVFEARGKILFTSGALRHPAFTKWRDDVKQSECTQRLV
jgi:ATP-dependent DNA ligase